MYYNIDMRLSRGKQKGIRKGCHAISGTSRRKTSKIYKKQYRGQGR